MSLGFGGAMATLRGTTGNDLLVGTAGDDFIRGLQGDDTLDGGGGNDVIVDEGDSNFVTGGAGNDRITVNNLFPSSYLESVPADDEIDAGDGDDFVEIVRGRIGSLTVDLGTGNDSLFLDGGYFQVDTELTLGAGQDRVTLGFGLGNQLRSVIEF